MDKGDGGDLGDKLGQLGRNLGMAAIGLIFMYLGGMLGSMTYPGIGPLVGMVIGLAVGLLIGFFAVKKYKDYAADAKDAKQSLMPAFLYKHPEYACFITVEHLADSDCLGSWTNSDFFIRIKCGDNPVKATCVKKDGKFNETFKLIVEPHDRSVSFELVDQDIFSNDSLGMVSVPTDNLYEDLQKKSPYQRGERLYSPKQKAGTLYVTYRLADSGAAAPASASRPYGTFGYYDTEHSLATDPRAREPMRPSTAPMASSQDPYGSYGASALGSTPVFHGQAHRVGP